MLIQCFTWNLSGYLSFLTNWRVCLLSNLKLPLLLRKVKMKTILKVYESYLKVSKKLSKQVSKKYLKDFWNASNILKASNINFLKALHQTIVIKDKIDQSMHVIPHKVTAETYLCFRVMWNLFWFEHHSEKILTKLCFIISIWIFSKQTYWYVEVKDSKLKL